MRLIENPIVISCLDRDGNVAAEAAESRSTSYT